MHTFLVEPLRSADVSTVIVIDALDEESVSEILGVRFFIASRLETHIVAGFRGPLLKKSTDVFILHKVEPRTIE